MALATHVRALSALPQLRVSILTNVELVGSQARSRHVRGVVIVKRFVGGASGEGEVGDIVYRDRVKFGGKVGGGGTGERAYKIISACKGGNRRTVSCEVGRHGFVEVLGGWVGVEGWLTGRFSRLNPSKQVAGKSAGAVGLGKRWAGLSATGQLCSFDAENRKSVVLLSTW